MNWFKDNFGKMPRESGFRFQVQELYYCRDLVIPRDMNHRGNMFEVSIRLESEDPWCRDTVNGEQLHVPFPNVAWKRPECETIIRVPLPRDTIAFRYTRETMEEFFRIGMEPGANCSAFIMSGEIESLTRKFMELIYRLYTPGVPDQIDWVCFQLYKTLLSAPRKKEREDSQETLIRNISMWLQTHYDEPMNMSELAKEHGMSHAKFYVEWKKVFDITPVQYLIQLKLDAASDRLRLTGKPIAEIVREVHFSNLYAFHRHFCRRFGMTPGEYRRKHAGGQEFRSGAL